jgi:type 1 fimbriae regulatory protein FimB
MYMEPDEIRALFRVITSKRDVAMFRIAYHRGLRAHEIGLLDLIDYRRTSDTLYVRRGKGSISREHSLIPAEVHALRLWLRERGDAPGPLFLSRQGKHRIHRSRLHQLMKRYCRAAGIRPEKAHMHALKHSCGTHLAERGNAADAIQDWLGHRSLTSTNIYMHFSKNRRLETFARNRDWR